MSETPTEGLILRANANGKMSLQKSYVKLSVSTAETYTISVGEWVDSYLIIPTQSGTIKIGTTVGGTEIVQEIPVVANQAFSIEKRQYFASATTLYFTTASAEIKIIIL